MVTVHEMDTENAPLLPTASSQRATFRQFLAAFWPITCIAFGGPQAHVALMHHKFVDNPQPPVPRVAQSTFLELYALAQSLPGPGSTQLATSLGATFGGLLGAVITFMVWHLPGFFVMSLAGVWFHSHLNDDASLHLIHRVTQYAIGLIAAAFAFVLIAAFKIVKTTCAPEPIKMAIALFSMFVAVTIPPSSSSWVFIVLLITGGVCYYAHVSIASSQRGAEDEATSLPEWDANISHTTGIALLSICALITLIVAALPSSDLGYRVLKIFWRIGLCVFGGGVIVIPMLMNEIVESGLLPASVFLAGFGLFGCVPGPMFNLAPFLGAAIIPLKGAFFGSLGLFGPGLLLQVGLLPFWERIRRVKTAQIFLQGTNSAASGLIVAGVWMLLKRTFVGPTAFALTGTAAAASVVYGVPPGYNVVLHGVFGVMLVLLNIGGPFSNAL